MSDHKAGGASGVFVLLGKPLSWIARREDEALLQEHLTTTTQRYCVLGLVVVCATPLVYTITRVAAPKRRASLVDLSTRVEEQWKQGPATAPGSADASPAAALAVGRAPRRADPVAGTTRVGHATVSYLRGANGTMLGSHTALGIHEVARRHNAYLLPISREVLRHQRATDADFAHACASAVSTTFARAAISHLARWLAADLAIHVAVFGICVAIDAGSATAKPGTMTGATTTAASDVAGSGGAPQSVVGAVVGSVAGYARWLLVELFAQGLFQEGATVSLSAYELYDFAHSVPTPAQACCLPVWMTQLMPYVHTLLWLGRPNNPRWHASLRQQADGSSRVAAVWRGLTPKGYYVYFLLQQMPCRTVRDAVVVSLYHVRYGVHWLRAWWRGEKKVPAPSSSTPSSVIPSRLTRDAKGAAAAEEAGDDKDEESRVRANRGSSSLSLLQKAMRHALNPHLITSCAKDVGYAGTRYVVTSTLTLLDGIFAGEEQRSANGLVGFLRGGNGLCFHVVGYLTGAHASLQAVQLLLLRK